MCVLSIQGTGVLPHEGLACSVARPEPCLLAILEDSSVNRDDVFQLGIVNLELFE